MPSQWDDTLTPVRLSKNRNYAAPDNELAFQGDLSTAVHLRLPGLRSLVIASPPHSPR